MTCLVVKRIWIEKSDCLWHTICVAEAPDLITDKDEDGVPAVMQSVLTHSQSELAQLLAVSQFCPVAAFFLETEDGRILNMDENPEILSALKDGSYRWASKT